MRLIVGQSTPDWEAMREYFTEIGEAIYLFPQNSLDPEAISGMNWTAEQLAEFLADKPISVVGTREVDIGGEQERDYVHIVTQDKIRRASLLDYIGTDDQDLVSQEPLYNISFDQDEPTMALFRSCAQYTDVAYAGQGKADILFIPSAAADLTPDLQDLVQAHRPKLNASGFIIQSEMQNLQATIARPGSEKFIFSIHDDSFVGTIHQSSVTSKLYIEHKL